MRRSQKNLVSSLKTYECFGDESIVAAASGNDNYVMGSYDYDYDSLVVVFDTASLRWNTDLDLCEMPLPRAAATALFLMGDKYLLVIGGEEWEEHLGETSYFIYMIVCLMIGTKHQHL